MLQTKARVVHFATDGWETNFHGSFEMLEFKASSKFQYVWDRLYPRPQRSTGFTAEKKNIFVLVSLVYTYILVNYNDLTATSLESWLIREIIPKWP